MASKIGVWSGTYISDYHTVGAVQEAIFSLIGRHEECDWIVKAGEAGTWQATWDMSPLAPSDPDRLKWLWSEGQALRPKLHVVPYVVLRGRPEWREAEIQQIADCSYCERVILNLEPGEAYWNGPTDPAGINDFMMSVREAVTNFNDIELAVIPRLSAIQALGGLETFHTWLNWADAVSWECYGKIAPDLHIEKAMRRIHEWFPGNPYQWGPEYRIPIIEAAEISDGWLDIFYTDGGIQIWHLG